MDCVPYGNVARFNEGVSQRMRNERDEREVECLRIARSVGGAAWWSMYAVEALHLVLPGNKNASLKLTSQILQLVSIAPLPPRIEPIVFNAVTGEFGVDSDPTALCMHSLLVRMEMLIKVVLVFNFAISDDVLNREVKTAAVYFPQLIAMFALVVLNVAALFKAKRAVLNMEVNGAQTSLSFEGQQAFNKGLYGFRTVIHDAKRESAAAGFSYLMAMFGLLGLQQSSPLASAVVALCVIASKLWPKAAVTKDENWEYEGRCSSLTL